MQILPELIDSVSLGVQTHPCRRGPPKFDGSETPFSGGLRNVSDVRLMYIDIDLKKHAHSWPAFSGETSRVARQSGSWEVRHA
jgi:hypothetical protein